MALVWSVLLTLTPALPEASAAQVVPHTDPSPADPTPGTGVVIVGGTLEQRKRLGLALDRFAETGLALPELEIVFDPSGESCKGHHGLFQTGFRPWRVSICSEVDSVYEHELAHAWEAATLTDEERGGFMKLAGYTVWSDTSVPWNRRGMEAAALVIQQGLGGLALPPALSDDQSLRLEAFHLLTGVPDPRLARWETRFSVVGDPEGPASGPTEFGWCRFDDSVRSWYPGSNSC